MQHVDQWGPPSGPNEDLLLSTAPQSTSEASEECASRPVECDGEVHHHVAVRPVVGCGVDSDGVEERGGCPHCNQAKVQADVLGEDKVWIKVWIKVQADY